MFLAVSATECPNGSEIKVHECSIKNSDSYKWEYKVVIETYTRIWHSQLYLMITLKF